MRGANTDKKPSSVKYGKLHSPAGMGAVAGIGAFGIAMGIDKICSYMFGLAKNLKSSVIVNSLVGLAIGLYTYSQARKAEQEFQNS